MSSRIRIEPGETGERLHNKVRVDLDGRFMLPTQQEHVGKVIEMSTGEMAIASDARPKIGQHVIVYIAELGRFEGTVESVDAEGFRLGMKLTALKHKKLAEQLVWFANQSAFDLPEHRRHKRFVPLTQLTTVQFSNGKECMARINDISASGVSVEINLSVNSKVTIFVGSSVFVGKKKAGVIRVFDGGFVAKFDEIFEEGAIDESIVL